MDFFLNLQLKLPHQIYHFLILFLLYYAPNHCTSHLYQYLAQKICEKIGINLDSVDLKKDPQRQGNRMIVYSCLENIVKFDVSKCLPPKLLFLNKPDVDTTNDYIDSIFSILKP